MSGVTPKTHLNSWDQPRKPSQCLGETQKIISTQKTSQSQKTISTHARQASERGLGIISESISLPPAGGGSCGQDQPVVEAELGEDRITAQAHQNSFLQPREQC